MPDDSSVDTSADTVETIAASGANTSGPAPSLSRLAEPGVITSNIANLVSALAGYFGKSVSPQALASGMSLKKGLIEETQLPELAHRASLKCSVKESALADLSFLDLPALLILNNGDASILLKRDGDIAELLTDSAGRLEVDFALLESRYDGRCYTLQPSVEREARNNANEDKNGHWFWSQAFSQKDIYIEAAGGSIVINILSLALPLFIMSVYDRIIPNFALESLAVLASGMFLVALVDFTLRHLRAYSLDRSGRNIDTILGNKVFNHLLYTRLQDHRSSGATANRVRELDVLREFLNSATLTLISDVPFLLLFIFVMYYIGGALAWVPIIVIPLLIGFFMLTQVPLYKLTKAAYLNASQRNTVLFEILNGMESLKAMGAESWAAYRWEKAHAAGVKTSFASRFYGLINQNVMVFSQTVSMLALMILGVFLVGDGALSFGALFAAVILNGRIMAPISQIAQLIGRFHGAYLAYTELNKLMNAPVERDALSASNECPEIKGNIVIDKLSFSYEIEGHEASANISVLDNISCIIKPGEKVAIVGTIGSGKSTLLKLLLNLISAESGTIRIEGIDSREIDPADLRSQIGYMPQNPHFFSGSIKENINLHKPLSRDSELVEAINLSGVGQWLASCPLGLSQPVGERGDYLSGGQRQSVALSRTLLGNPKLLLMDEPTSLLDSQAETNFVQRMHKMLGDKTLIVTTHRPAMLALVDRILVLDKGRIVMDGEKQAVLDKLAGKS